MSSFFFLPPFLVLRAPGLVLTCTSQACVDTLYTMLALCSSTAGTASNHPCFPQHRPGKDCTAELQRCQLLLQSNCQLTVHLDRCSIDRLRFIISRPSLADSTTSKFGLITAADTTCTLLPSAEAHWLWSGHLQLVAAAEAVCPMLEDVVVCSST